jgi:hypothetical protein
MLVNRVKLTTLGALLIAGTVVGADGLRFSDFVPLLSSAGQWHSRLRVHRVVLRSDGQAACLGEYSAPE